MAKRLEIKEGDRFGKLTVIREVESKEDSRGGHIRQFECRCDICGKHIIRQMPTILRGKTEQGCGCVRKYPIGVNSRIGSLVVMQELKSKPRTFLCQCDCGNTCIRQIPRIFTHCKCNRCIHSVDIPNLPNEEWKDIDGYDGRYKISNLGRVKSMVTEVKRDGGSYVTKTKILQHYSDNYGYPIVGLVKDGKKRIFKIHRLVAEYFIPNPDNKPFIDHIDTDKKNFSISNLRWVTSSENSLNPITRKQTSSNIKEQWRRDKHRNIPRKVRQYTLDGTFIKEWESVMAIANELGYSQSHISHCCIGKSKTGYGFIWRYVDKV